MKQCLLRFFSILNFSFLIFNSASAQFAFIPDTNFRNFLVNNGFAGCMMGDSLDTTCTAVVNATAIDCQYSNIYDLTGIEYFSGLGNLECKSNNLTFLPSLPAGLFALDCSMNQLTSLNTLPPGLAAVNCKYNSLSSLPLLSASIRTLDCSYNQLTILPSIPSTMVELKCAHNQLTTLPSLPANLNYLYCSYNAINLLPTLPDSLFILECHVNQLSQLPGLPTKLEILKCHANLLTSLPVLPPTLEDITCGGNVITYLPALPNSLLSLSCPSNQIDSMPALPSGLKYLYCNQNQLTELPALPAGLTSLDCYVNNLTILPSLPASLNILNCSDNQIANLPLLPNSLFTLKCSRNLLISMPVLPNDLSTFECNENLLTSLPAIPAGIIWLKCDQNQIVSIPNFPDSCYADISFNPISCLATLKKFSTFLWSNTNIACLPNAGNIANAIPLIDTLSLCQLTDSCPAFWSITGGVYFDNDSSCTQDSSEVSLRHIPVVLDSGGVELQRMLTNYFGQYSFQTGLGNYEVRIDTVNAPYRIECPVTFNATSVLTAVDSMDSNIDFSLLCNGFDLMARSISTLYLYQPGFQNTVFLNVGDAMNIHGASCASGISGTVQAIIDNLITYISPVAGGLVPSSVSGDTLTWNISDFSLINPLLDFNIVVEVSTAATISDSICIQLNVNPIAGDNIPANNALTECYPVRGSYDPNEKYMSPSGLVDTSQQWFTFTIFFQNVGNAPAEDIYILDTLDQNLDATTFTYLSSSHEVITQLLPGKILRFNYPDINLIDSTTNEPGSHGYVQYKVKRKENLQVNTTISNTAYIYFDFNAAVATNTVNATFVLNVGIIQPLGSQFGIYPNPVGEKLYISSVHYPIKSIEVFDLLGQKLIEKQFTGRLKSATIDVEVLSRGVYFLKVQTEKYSFIRKFVKE